MAEKRKNPLVGLIEFVIAWAIFRTLGLLPRSLARMVSGTIAAIVYRLLGRLRRTGRRNLELAFPELAADEREALLRESFQNLGRVLAETSKFPRHTKKSIQDIIDIDSANAFQKLCNDARDKGKSVLVVTGHLGNWELFAFAFGALFEPISFLARPLDNQRLESFTYEIRSKFGNRPLSKTNSIYSAIRILRKGGVIGVLADVNAHPKEGVFVPFFGIPACTTVGVAAIAIRANAVIVPGFCAWDDHRQRYITVFEPAIEPPQTGDMEADILSTTAAYTEALERLIRQYPGQWLWIHRRWKTRPPGDVPLY
ncbi:lysophospholipid acyltransferase family protein [Leptolyngbya sp. 7M]|uniref:lysophospholipid acyltransferase family protein n=1 Tax=Leptolyngbya sp. 7M TaxID=2812896 RepID=UPI001B8D7083|nr:lysophospholipid acyltransferase family protein [Leptolyngbya sp. 7M]QYO65687.1 lysophospholipid acyltransferase family protein [Leptolyngbya sp. 7M]